MANEFVARNGIIALDNSAITGSLNVSGGITGSLFGTASFSNTASFVNPLRQDVIITGSLSVSGSILLNGTGSIIGSGSTNYLSKFTGTTALGNSQIFDNGTSVGIGTTSPTSYTNFTTLSINNATAGGLIDLLQNGTSNFRILTSTTSNMLNGVGNIPMVFHTNGTEKMRITAAGRLLIGTTTESTYLLDVNGTARVSGTALFTGNIGGNAWNYDSGNVRWVFGTATDQLSRFYTIQNAWTTTAATLAVRNIASQTANSLQIENSSSTVLSGFNASGSLFINKTTANATLDVNGPTIISGSLTVFTGSAVELQVTNTGVRIGNVITDTHTVTGSLNVSGSITTTGTITAQTLVVQTITSSVSFITGSTRFGSLSSNTHQFTGSVSITGSLTANGNTTISGSTVITGSLLISTGSLSDFLRTSNAGVTNFRISSSGYPVWGVSGFDVISVPSATWTPIVTWDGANVQWGDTRANRSIMTPGIGGGYVTVPNITFINTTYATQVNNLFGNSFIVNNNNVTSTLGTVNMVIQATGSQTGNMLQFKNGAGSVLSGVDASGSLFINKTTANARLDVNGSTIISGSLTVFTGSAVELQVTNTGVRIGNIITDAHTVTGSLNVSGSVTATNFTGSLLGTASFATSASFALTASFVPTSSLTGNFFVQGGNSFGAQALLGTNDAQNLAFETNGTVRMTISGSDGNVGIGTTSPTEKLEVNGSALITGSLGITGSLSVSASDATINGVRVGRGNNNVLTNTAVGNTALNAVTAGGNTAVGYLALQSGSSGVGNTAVAGEAGSRVTTGDYNTLIGYKAGSFISSSSQNTMIGWESYKNPASNSYSGSKTLSITAGSSENAGGEIRLWAPDHLYVSSSITKTVVEVDTTQYSGFVMDYVVEISSNAAGQRTGTYWASFDNGTTFVSNEQTTADIGDTTGLQFSGSFVSGSGNFRLSLANKTGNVNDAGIDTSFRFLRRMTSL